MIESDARGWRTQKGVTMKDSKMQDKQITRETLCSVGNHVFAWTSTSVGQSPPLYIQCDCRAYSLEELQEKIANVSKRQAGEAS